MLSALPGIARLGRNPGKRTALTFHRDRLSHSASENLAKVLQAHRVTPSMSRQCN
jgi:transposase InsO family protein